MFNLLAQTYTYTTTGTPTTTVSSGTAAAILAVYLIVFGVVGIFFIVCMWKIFTKASKPGWASIIPVYNTWVLCEIAGKPGWWAFLFFIPIVNIVLSIIVYIELSKAFGKEPFFAVLLIILPVIGLPMLAFGKAQYQGGTGAQLLTPPAPPTPMQPTAPQPPTPPVVPPQPPTTPAAV